MHIVLDVNSQLYPMQAGEKYRMVLSQTLTEDGSAVNSISQVSFYLIPYDRGARNHLRIDLSM